MDTEYMKTYPEGLLISETQMKTSVRFCITPVRRGYHKKRLKKTSTGKDVKKILQCWCEYKFSTTIMENSLEVPQKE